MNINFFNEDDEISDEEYYKEDEADILIETEESDLSDDEYDEKSEDENDDSNDSEEDEDFVREDDEEYIQTYDTYTSELYSTKSTGKYKPKDFTQAFLKNECLITLESSKTLCKFEYRGNYYTGKVLKKITNEKYVFLVDKITNNKDAEESGLKLIYIPDASFISGKPAQ